MSHAVYQTPALILKTKNTRESNKLVYLYTKKFGLVYANMQSLRELKSKMRYHVHPFSLVDVDLVAGRSIWRITGIHEKKTAFDIIDTPWYRIISLVSDNLIRLCTGEEENEVLWNNIVLFLNAFEPENEKYIKEYEVIVIVRVLHALGYWDSEDVVLQTENPYQKNVFEEVRGQKKSYIQKINQSLEDSQL